MQNRFIRCPHCGVPHDAAVAVCPTTGQPVARSTKRSSPDLASKPSTPAPPTSSAPPPAEVILGARYRLLHILGEGGMGTVWAAEHQLLKKQVAVKLLLPPIGFGAVKGLIGATLLFLLLVMVFEVAYGGDSQRPEWMTASRT